MTATEAEDSLVGATWEDLLDVVNVLLPRKAKTASITMGASPPTFGPWISAKKQENSLHCTKV
jgi:hypothetical protein